MIRLNSLLGVMLSIGLYSGGGDELPRPVPLPPPPPPVDIRPNLGGGIGPAIPIPLPGATLTVIPGPTQDGRGSIGGQLVIPIGRP